MISKDNTKNNTKRIKRLLIFCLVLLLNPNANIIDILPDFIAYFIIVKLLEKPSDLAAYFEEAKKGFLRLAFVSLAKIPTLILVYTIRSTNTRDNDIFALVALIFAVIELILLIPAIKNLFSALFHLGERTNALALIKPFKISKNRNFTPEALRSFSFIFVVCKSVLFFLPETLRLTSTTDSGAYISSFSKFYPRALLLSIVIVLICGIFWFSMAKKYIKAIIAEGKFNDALEFMQTELGRERYASRTKVRQIKFSLTMLAIASFFSIELIFSNLEYINLLPHFIYGAIMLYTMNRILKHSKSDIKVYISGGFYILSSAVAYFFSFRFLNNFDYVDLISNSGAVDAYMPVIIFSLIECIALIVFMLFSSISLKVFVRENFGLNSHKDIDYSRSIKAYHKSLMRRVYILFSLSALSGIAKCVHVMLNRNMTFIFSNVNDITRPTFAVSKLPWFNLVVFATSVIYIGYSLYLTSDMKDDICLKYDTTENNG